MQLNPKALFNKDGDTDLASRQIINEIGRASCRERV